MIKDIFEQGDPRYDNDYSAYSVARFYENKGIIIDKKLIKDRFKPSEEELNKITPPQQYYKFIGRKILERYFYKFICYEASFAGYRPDILAKHHHHNETLLVECKSCRTSKAIIYLKEKGAVLWVLSMTETGLPHEPIPLYIIKRGPNWHKCLELYNKSSIEMLKGTKNPHDSL